MKRLFLLILFLVSFTCLAGPVNFYNNEINIGSQSASYTQVQLDFTTATPSISGRILFDPSLEKLRYSHDGGTTTVTFEDWRDSTEDIVTTGSITAVSFHGDGSNLTGISGGGGATSVLTLTEVASPTVNLPDANKHALFFDTVNDELFSLNSTGTYSLISTQAVFITHELSDGSNGGNSSVGAWNARPLNTIRAGDDFASLVSNQVILQPGKYVFFGEAFFNQTNESALRITNITSGVFCRGPTTRASSAASNIKMGTVSCVMEISVASTFEMQYWTQTNTSVGDFGIATASVSGNECFANLTILRIK